MTLSISASPYHLVTLPGLCCGDDKRERATLVERALHPHPAAEQLNQWVHQRQAQTGAAGLDFEWILGPIKPVENAIELFCGNTDACITYLDQCVAALYLQALTQMFRHHLDIALARLQRDRAAARRVFHRIREHVRQNLVQTPGIGAHQR